MDPKLRRIYNYLKVHQGSFLREIAAGSGVRIDETNRYLLEEAAKGLIEVCAEKPGEECRFYVRIVLDSVHEARKKTFSWEPLAMAAMPTKPAWENPHIRDTAHRDQGGIGSCTGMTGAGIMDTNYQELVPDKPTAEDWAKIQRDVVDSPSEVKHDVLLPQTFSGECAYRWGRVEGNIVYPSGGSTQAVMKTLVKRGICFEDEWPTSKDGRHCYLEPLSAEMQAKVDFSAPLHKLDGFVSLGNNFDRVCAGIEQYGKVALSLICYENMSEMRGGDGTFLDPKGSEDGAHALEAYGYDENWIKVVHTWGAFCGRYGRFSRKYAQKGLMEAFAPIDAVEAARIRENYQKVTISVTIPCQVFIDEQYVGDYPKDQISPQLKIGQTYRITVVDLTHSSNQKTVEYTPVKGTDALPIDLPAYVEPPEPTPIQKLITAIVEFIKRFFGKA